MKLAIKLLIVLLLLIAVREGFAAKYVAFSLKQAQSHIAEGKDVPREIGQLAGITRLVGAVMDANEKDVILVGIAEKEVRPLTLDEFVVALRARMVHNEWPLVSLDNTPETNLQGLQKVRFEGKIEDTDFGKQLLDADVVLKKLALGKQIASVWGVQSYADLCEEAAARGDDSRASVLFWFFPMKTRLLVQPGVFAVASLSVGTRTQLLGTSKSSDTEPGQRDSMGDKFASDMTAAYNDLSLQFSELARVKQLLSAVAVADGLRDIDKNLNELSVLLHKYRVTAVNTPKTMKSLASEGRLMKITGGIELRALLLRLQDEDVTALREAVLRSRPDKRALSWYLPLDGWQLAGTDGDSISPGATGAEFKDGQLRQMGVSINRETMRQASSSSFNWTSLQTPLPQPKVTFDTRSLTPQAPVRIPSIGGVMLSGTAQVTGAGSPVSLTSGNFSLVVEGDKATCDLRTYQRFVTALWALYYSRTDPGISIDPIEAGGKKHMVRYIGKVINTDLGRVMREADYLMKQWAVGTSRPNVQGFLNPDEISGRRGTLYYGASSRFWFVPEDMRFKEGNGMLLYDSGRMRVRTEFNLQNTRGMKADPSNEQFADFLTEKYHALAQQHPVLSELLDYAKLVQLAKYLKQNHVPLFWFLMANKDLVLTEDSPGTVDALAKGSDYFKNIYIEGGVDMATNGQYVFDQTAVAAINQALSHLPEGVVYKTSLGTAPAYVPGNFSFDLKGQSYSTVPQSSLTSGKDRRGVRYQTDLAVHAEGFELGDQALESLRPEILRREIFHKLGPVTAGMSESERREKFDGLLKKAMEESKGGVDTLLAKLSTLKNKDFAVEAEFADALKRALGSEAVGRFGDLIVKQARYARNFELVRYLSPQGATSDGEFGAGWHFLIPYRVQPAGPEKRKFLNALLPVKMDVVNLVSGEKEVLTFSEERYSIAGYVPDKAESSQIVGLFLLSDGSYRMADKLGNEFQFGPDGYLKEMVFSKDHRTRIEYGFTENKTQPGYEVRPDKSGYESIQNIRLPKAMLLHDFSTGLDEKLVFNKNNPYGIIGYTPKEGSGSRYRFLALMSNGSFALSDKEGNETHFDPSGKWTSTRSKVVKGFSQGQFRMEFQHDVNSGSPRVVEVRVMRDGRPAPLHVVKYEYGQDQRLAKVVNAATGS